MSNKTCITIENCCCGSGSGEWVKIGTFKYSDFTAGALTQTIPSGYVLPAKGVISDTYLNLKQTFLGGLVIQCHIDFGTILHPNTYVTNFNVHSLPPAPIQPVAQIGLESMVVSTTLDITITTVGDVISNLTQGEFDLYSYVTMLP